MKKKLFALTFIATVGLLAACHKSGKVTTPAGTVYLDLPKAMPEYYGTADSLNTKAQLGRVLFYDARLSLNNTISCGSCHKQAAGFADNAALSRGFEGRLTSRNSKGFANLMNVGLSVNNSVEDMISISAKPLFWDGREVNLKNLVKRPITNHIEMGINNPETIPAKLATVPYYKDLFVAAFGDENITTDRISTAIAVFMGSITSGSSRVEQFNRGNTYALSALEKQGKDLFNSKYNCASCHNTFGGYSMTTFMDIGLDGAYTDPGLGAVSGSQSDMGKFSIPSLSNVALTAPYMHDGRFKTLDDVIDHYSHGIKNSTNLSDNLKDESTKKAKEMNISTQEKSALIAFLNAFTDEKMVTDPKFSNPFKVK